MSEKTNSISSRMFSAAAVVMIAALAVSVAKAEETPALPPITTNGGASLHGKFIWSDLVTSSFEDARDFYTELLDLEWELHSEMPVRYGLFMRDGRPVAGLAERAAGEQDATTHWVHYVSLADVAKAQIAAPNAGGRALVESEQLPGRGDIAVI